VVIEVLCSKNIYRHGYPYNNCARNRFALAAAAVFEFVAASFSWAPLTLLLTLTGPS
jgi:hypothetical protein